MACSILTTLALTATLLGNQGLKLESQVEPSGTRFCSEAEAEVSEPLNPNALAILKDARGEVLSETKIRIAQAQFFDYGKLTHSHSHGGAVMGGAFPEKQSTFIFKFPRTARAASATTIQVQMLDGSFKQSTSLKPSVSVGTGARVGLR